MREGRTGLLVASLVHLRLGKTAAVVDANILDHRMIVFRRSDRQGQSGENRPVRNGRLGLSGAYVADFLRVSCPFRWVERGGKWR